MRLSILTASLLFSSFVSATETCPDPLKLKNICMMVGNRMPAPKPHGEIVYRYQLALREAACVAENEVPSKVSEKVRLAWQASENLLVCNSVQFDVMAGNLLKFAVSKKNDDFIDDVIGWGVNLNRIDPSDQRTVLDYIKFHIDRNKGNELEGKFEIYYNQFRKAGAKHSSELETSR